MCVTCQLFRQNKLGYVEAMKALKELALTDTTFLEEHLDDATDFIDGLEVQRLNSKEQVEEKTGS